MIAGWPVVWSGGEDEGTRFAYLEPATGPAMVFELMESTDGTLAKLMRDAAAEWDRSDPIRVV